jgi:endonuclease III
MTVARAQVGSNGNREAEIVKRLLDLWEQIPSDERETLLIPGLEPEARELVRTNPFAFLLAASLDRGTKAEIIWTLPYLLRQALGHLDPCIIAQMSAAEIRALLEQLPKKPRYINDASRTIVSLARMVCDEFHGEATRLWDGGIASETMKKFQEIPGVGPGIAAMLVILLERLGMAQFSDRYNIPVKPDTHVIRVMVRLGLIPPQSTEQDAVAKARALKPDYPGALDSPLWYIGRKFCHSISPACAECPLNDLCPRVGV